MNEITWEIGGIENSLLRWAKVTFIRSQSHIAEDLRFDTSPTEISPPFTLSESFFKIQCSFTLLLPQ